MVDYLIIRCSASRTLAQRDYLRSRAAFYGIEVEDVTCPTFKIVCRTGRNRARKEIEVPILGSFLFVRKPHDSDYWASFFEATMPRMSVMRNPGGGFATCTDIELGAVVGVDEAKQLPFNIGDIVQVVQGFMKGVTGSVKSIRQDGEVRLRIINSQGWKLTTLLISGHALTLSQSSYRG